MKKISKLHPGDKVAVLSPSFAGPGAFPWVFELGLERMRNVFGLVPVEYPTTRKLGATTAERAKDMISAFENPDIKAVFASMGGDDQAKYIYDLPKDPFVNNPKPFFGYSDNSHFCNFLFQNGIPSYYGGCVMTQFAMQKEMDPYTIKYLKAAMFENKEVELSPSDKYSEIGLDWSDESLLNTKRFYEKNSAWVWDGLNDANGLLWGGCVESIDTMLKNNTPLPSLLEFETIILLLETSESVPPSSFVAQFIDTLGQRKILSKIQGVCVGRAKAWEFDKLLTKEERDKYHKEQHETIISSVRSYNVSIPIVQNLDFGHTNPQIPMPYGKTLKLKSSAQKIFAAF